MPDHSLSTWDERIEEGHHLIHKMVSGPKCEFKGLGPTKIPSKPGLYVISDKTTGEILRAGRTDDQTLSNRIYRNHLMGSQTGNLRAQLVANGLCEDMESAKEWIRDRCVVRWLTIEDVVLDLRWAEHFILAVLRPRFSS
ncbi:MAG: hypothetical protein M1343_12435 [Chloroflexi bacterium]|nr:hypothetical protein [Chloroflexota bacterium]MDA8187557.1 hypothetical protein [Dehalococcoidales bacterium]